MLFGVAVIGGISIPSYIKGDFGKAREWITPLDVLSVDQSTEAIKGAIVYVSQQYGLKENQVMKTIQCESNYQTVIWGDHTLAYGVAQFHKSTFDLYCKGNYYSARDQLVCLAQMWQRRMQTQWSCYTKLFK